jgi:hypothetical protein
MDHWCWIEGTVKAGYGVASGRAADPRFPGGTIAMQMPFFQAGGLDLTAYFPGTLNLAIAPHTYQILQAKQTFRNLKWSPTEPAEDFSFFDCLIQWQNHSPQPGLIYYPHPETKPEHFQAADVLEIITGAIAGLQYGDRVQLAYDPQQILIQ